MDSNYNLSDEEMHSFFVLKYGDVDTTGWSPRMRYRFGYYLPSDYYEATVAKIVTTDTRWIDVGGGRAIFPHNVPLSAELAERAHSLVAVDPSVNVFDNPYTENKVQCLIENYESEELFDLATFRMVAEHIEHPDSVLKRLASLVRPDGVVMIYTVNKYSPVSILARWTPFWSHFMLIRFLTGKGEKKDVFPVVYRMNTRSTLREQFERHGFYEEHFLKLDDLSSSGNFRLLHSIDNWIRKILRRAGLRYPEFNLLGIYRKRDLNISKD